RRSGGLAAPCSAAQVEVFAHAEQAVTVQVGAVLGPQGAGEGAERPAVVAADDQRVDVDAAVDLYGEAEVDAALAVADEPLLGVAAVVALELDRRQGVRPSIDPEAVFVVAGGIDRLVAGEVEADERAVAAGAGGHPVPLHPIRVVA